MNNNLGLVLSGGGVRAIAHIGFIEVLLENNIVPNNVSGTSAGAMVAALYAAGYSPEEMLSFFKETPILKFSLFARGKPGLMDSEKYKAYFKKHFPDNTFESLKYPLTITATNLLEGKLEFFNTGELIRPIVASSALPPIFSPLQINGKPYCDGGVMNNFPIEPLVGKCSKIIGSYINPADKISKKDIKTSLKLLNRVHHLGLVANNTAKYEQCDYVFLPTNMKNIGFLDSKGILKAYRAGYQYANYEIANIKKALHL